MKEATLLFLSVGLLVAVNSQTTAPSISKSSIRVIAPKKIIPGETFDVYVYGEETKRPSQQSVVVSLKYSSGRTLLNGSRRVVKPDSFTKIVLKTPADADPEVGEYYIFVDMRISKENTKNKSIPVTVFRYNRIILLQTDKSVYKPDIEETVMIRAIVLDRQMKSATGAVTFTIQNPALYTIVRVSNITLDFGVAKFEYSLFPESVLGTYRLCAAYEGLPEGQRSCSEFEVQRNDPSRFSCFVTHDDEVFSSRNAEACFSVSANYISGQKVNGTVTASLKIPYTGLYCPLHRVVRREIDGTTRMCINTSFFQIDCWAWEDILIDVNVTDFTSGTIVRCEGQRTLPISYYSDKLTIVEEDGGFHPCQTTTVKVVASTWSGKTKVANISLSGTIYTKSEIFCGKRIQRHFRLLDQQTDSSGMATFSICMPCKALSVYIFVAEAKKWSEREFSSTSTRRSVIYSSGRVVLSSSKQKLQIGETANITASFSHAATADYYIIRNNEILDVGRCLPKRDRNARYKHKQLCKSGGIKRTCYISFPVTLSMAPEFTVIVSQKNLATARIAFDVISNMEPKISLQFQENEVRPGAKANLIISSLPMSYVGVMAVDQNAHVQEDENQLTTSKLYQELDTFDEPKRLPVENYVCGWDVDWYCHCKCIHPGTNSTVQSSEAYVTEGNDTNYCSRDCTRFLYTKRYCSYINANDLFRASGFQVYGSETAPLTSCQKPNPPPKSTNDCCSWCKKKGGYLQIEEGEGYNDFEGRIEGPPMYSQDIAITMSLVRTHSPKTWLWIDHKFGNDTLREQVTVPDTMTSWVSNAFAVSPSTSISIASSSTLKVSKSFFVDIDLPHSYSATRGELVKVTLTVYNYLQDNLTAIVNVIVSTSDLRLVQGKRNQMVFNNRSLTMVVSAGEKESVSYYLLPLRNGHLPITATARSKSATDSVTRTMFVEAEGVKETRSESFLLCLKGNDSITGSSKEIDLPVTKVFNISLPSDVVPDSESAVVTLTTNYVAPTIHDLDNLLLLPIGHGESIMRNFAPAVYIARYLDIFDELHGATLKKAYRFIRTGYQAEIGYQRIDGSYSFNGQWGDCGIMWLTAFVLRSFSQANSLVGISINNKVQDDAIRFIQNNQNLNGSFPPVCRPLYDFLTGCMRAHGNCALTAYVTLALLEAGVSPNNQSVKMALKYLSNSCISLNCSSPYKLALVSFTLLRGLGHNKDTEKSLEALRRCAVSDGYYTHWRYSTDFARCQSKWAGSYYCQTRSCDVETTGYALLAFTYKGDIASSLPIVRWLNKHLNNRRRHKFEQDMVVGLQALFEYAKLTTSNKRAAARILLSADQLEQTLSIDSSIAMQTQTVKIPRLPTVLNVTASGKGCLLVSVDAKYNVPKRDAFTAFDVSATAALRKDACAYVVTVCNKWLRYDSDTSTVAVTEITFFSGFHPVESELNQLNGCRIERTKFDGRVIKIYFEEITQTKCCFDVSMKRESVVENLQGVPVITYNYHEPELRGGTMLYADQECP